MPETTHSSFAGLVSYTTEQLPDDTDLATAITIRRMSQYIREDAGSPEVLRTLREMGVTGRDAVTDAHRIFRWIRLNVRFVTDARNAARMTDRPAQPQAIELLIRPVDLLRMNPKEGDCDDFSMLSAALLLAAGIPCELVTIKANAEDPELWSHVYVEAHIDGRPVPFDSSHGSFPGWEYPRAFEKKRWSIGATLQGLAGDYIGSGEEFPIGQVPGSSTTGGNNWQSWITTGVNAAAQIGLARYGQAPAGTYRQGADGSIYYRQQPGAPALQFPSSTGNGTSLLLIGAAIFALVLMTRGHD